MKKCLLLAIKGMGKVNPNPMVGCVIVKDNKIISKGYHRKIGAFHAERDAIIRSKDSVHGASLYVNLQPCSHHGKTPPCTDIIISSGIKTVIYGVEDPNKESVKRTDKILKDAGIKVVKNILEEECINLNREFFTNILKGRTFVFSKWAQTIDGKIADHTYNSKYISGADTKDFVHKLRYRADAIAVGVGTVINDDPMLNIRGLKNNKVLKRIIFDTNGSIPLDSRIVNSSESIPTILIVKNIEEKKEKLLKEKYVKVLKINPRKINNMLEVLYKDHNICSLMLEGGGVVNGSFFNEECIDEYNVIIAPKLCGDPESVTCMNTSRKTKISDFRNIELYSVKKYGQEVLIKYFSKNVQCLQELLKK